MTDTITLPDVSDDEHRTLNRLLTDLGAKQPRNLLRASFYDGKHAARQVGSIIPPQYWRTGFVLGWSGKAVDFLARRCNIDRFVWPDGTFDEVTYRAVWERNHLRSEVSSAAVSSLIHGPAFLVNTVGDERRGEPRGLMHVKDAMSATGTWNARARRLDDLLSITGRDGQGKVTSLVLYLDGITIEATRDSSGWAVNRTEHRWGMPADPMVYKPRVGRPFGASRISRPIMSLHESALRTMIRLEAHDDVYTIPDLWMLGADESIFKNADGSQKASWQVVLGRIKGLPDDENRDDNLARADVKQFPASSPEPHLASLNAKAKMFAREASLPDTAVAITDLANPTSAEAYDASQHELIAEAEGATDDWTVPLRRWFVRGLAMQADERSVPDSWATIDVKWRNPRFLSRAAEADAGVKQLTAAPWLAETEVGLELLGLTPQQATRALAERRRAQGREVLAGLRDLASQRTPLERVTGAGGD